MAAALRRPRAVVAYDVARRLLQELAGGRTDLPPTYAARLRLDELRDNEIITSSEYHQLTVLLGGLGPSDMNRVDRMDDLVQEVTTNLTVCEEEFPMEELERLRGLL